MATNGTMTGLLKTPSQVRKDAQSQLMQESFARSQQMISSGGTTALPGIISRYGAQAAQRGAQSGAGLLRGVTGGIGSAVGGDVGQSISDLGVSTDERQARMGQEALQGMNSNDPISIKQAAMRLRQLGLVGAANKLDQKANQLEAQTTNLDFKKKEEARAESRLNMEKERLQMQKDTAQTNKEKAKLDQQVSQLSIDESNLRIKQLKDARGNEEELKATLAKIIPTLNDSVLSPSLRKLVATMPPEKAFNFVAKAVEQQQKRARTSALSAQINQILKPSSDVEGQVAGGGSIDAINSRYSRAIKIAGDAKNQNLAKTLEDERKALVAEKNTVRDIEEAKRKSFRGDTTAKIQRTVVNEAKKGLAFLNAGTGAGDVASVIGFMKSLDPNSVVRESEFAIAQSIGSALDTFKATFESYNTGQRLTPSQRDSLKEVLILASESAVEDYNYWRGNEAAAFAGRGYDADYIVGKELMMPSNSNENTNNSDDDAEIGAGFVLLGDEDSDDKSGTGPTGQMRRRR
tara:strand:- start:4977 stop:6533 length:1557 start_codon:yes stop_codon:yes gene_type:complete